MSELAESWPALAAYHPALLMLAVLCLVVLIQSFLAGALGLAKSDEVPGRPLKGDHPDRSFRIIRTCANSTENLPAFAATLFLAVFGGVSAVLVNWLAAIHLAARLGYWVVYYSGIGKVAGGPRTILFVIGLVANIVLALAAVVALAF